MYHPEVEAAVNGVLVCHAGVKRPPKCSQFATLEDPRQPGWPAVTTYYTDSGQLYCLAVNALRGPQIVLGDVDLVGRVPSELEREIGDYAAARGVGVRYSITNDPAIETVGVVVRVQRAGDVVLTRPVFVGREWEHRFWDSSESWIPAEEWQEIHI
jgi:hypothetical protein